MDEIVIVTYSPKYKAYQKRIRKQQISRAVIMMEQPGKNIYDLDLDRISEEEKYDGFYAVIINLEGMLEKS